MISRCPLCRAFVGTVHAPTHAPRLARHPSAEAVSAARALALKFDHDEGRELVGAALGWCRGSGGEAAPLLAYVAHPVAPPAVGPLSPEDRAFLDRDVDAHRVAVRINLANADRWYRALLYRLPHLDLVMPWRPMLDHLFDDGPTGPNRAHGLRTAEAAAARCDIVLALVKQTPGMLREAAACVGTGGRLVSLEQLGATPPATWPSDDDLPPEIRS